MNRERHQRRPRSYGRSLAIIACALMLTLLSCRSEPVGIAIQPGQIVPMLEVSALDRSRTFGETISGHYAVVSVWATWCAPCRTELPQLQALADETGSKGIAIVTINIDDNDHRVREWLRQERVRLPVFRDQHGSVTRLVWGITSVPQILVLAPDGRLLWSGQTFDRTAILEQMKIGWATRGEPRQTADRGRALLCPPGDYGVAVIATSCGSMSLIRT